METAKLLLAILIPLPARDVLGQAVTNFHFQDVQASQIAVQPEVDAPPDKSTPIRTPKSERMNLQSPPNMSLFSSPAVPDLAADAHAVMNAPTKGWMVNRLRMSKWW